MKRDDSLYLQHIRDSIERIATYLDGVDHDQFMNTPLVQDGVIRQLQIIGEAVKRISAPLRQSQPDIPWQDMAGMRDKLTHDYMGVDLTTVWLTATEDLPILEGKIRDLD